MENRDFKGVWIPKEIYLNKELSWSEKILLIEINSLDNNEEKGCFASNKYLSEFIGISESSMANMISKLKAQNYIFQVFFDGRNRGLRVHKNMNAGFISATRMPQYADGTAIPSFLDYSGNNYNATQASGTLQPTFQTNEFGAKPSQEHEVSLHKNMNPDLTFLGSQTTQKNEHSNTINNTTKKTISKATQTLENYIELKKNELAEAFKEYPTIKEHAHKWLVYKFAKKEGYKETGWAKIMVKRIKETSLDFIKKQIDETIDNETGNKDYVYQNQIDAFKKTVPTVFTPTAQPKKQMTNEERLRA